MKALPGMVLPHPKGDWVFTFWLEDSNGDTFGPYTSCLSYRSASGAKKSMRTFVTTMGGDMDAGRSK